MRAFKTLISAAALLLAGCGADPEYFLLPPPQATQTRVDVAPASVAVAEIGLPSYAEAAEIAVLMDTGSVMLNDDALWADTPRRALTRHLVSALQARVDAEVGGEPWPELDRPALRLEVIADRLIGRNDGILEFTGTYTIVAPESGRIVASDRFAQSVPITRPGYEGLLAAHARAIDMLADVVAARIARLGAIS